MTVRYDIAMHRLYAGRQYGVNGPNYDDINWFEDVPKPTAEELEAWWNANATAEANKMVDAERRMGYPTTDELIVALWEKLVEVDGLTSDAIADIQARRLSVKQQYPKG